MLIVAVCRRDSAVQNGVSSARDGDLRPLKSHRPLYERQVHTRHGSVANSHDKHPGQ